MGSTSDPAPEQDAPSGDTSSTDTPSGERQPIDAVTLAVLSGRLEQIADEMDATLFRSAFNPIIAEAHDACHGLYHPQTGATLVQGKSGLPIFVGTMSFAVGALIEHCRARGQTPEPGDVYIFNDPWRGGSHLNDFKLVRPYYRDGKLFAYLASVGHWHDVGGAVPGNYNPVATEAFAEAFVVPPVRIVHQGVLQSDVLDILQANSRLPRSVYGDLNGQLGALQLGVRRLDALLDEYGDCRVWGALEELSARAERLMRAHIAALPDGEYEARDILDNDGIRDEPLEIVLTLKVAADTLTLDFRGSAAACAGPVNISYATLVAACYVALKHLFVDVPANAGVLAPVTVEVAEGSMLDAHAPRPTGGYTETILRVIDVIFRAMAEVAPERVCGNAYGTINALSLAGHKSDSGQRWVMFSFFGGGLGGHRQSDGLSHGNAPISTATIPPVEILEAAYPVMFRRWALRPDSGGPGRHRGGLGADYELELLEAEADVFLFGERGKAPPQGVMGGGSGALNVFHHDAGADPPGSLSQTPAMVSKLVGLKLHRGQRLRLWTPGGGGYGDPRSRPVDEVAEDVRLGYISTERAHQDYGVVIKPDGTVDSAATQTLRGGVA